MSRAAARRRAWEQPDRGTTLTEMLVVMIILSIVVAATAALTVGFTRTTAQNTARQDQIDAARTAVERISKTARTAVKPSQLVSNCNATCQQASAFAAGSAYSMRFYANLDNPRNTVGPSQITYTVATSGTDAGVLIEKVQRPDPTATPPPGGYTYCNAEAAGASQECRSRLTVRRYASGVRTTTPVFTYYGSDGGKLDVGADGQLSADRLQKVLAVEVALTVTSTGPSAPRPTTYIQRITLPNAQAVVQEGENP